MDIYEFERTLREYGRVRFAVTEIRDEGDCWVFEDLTKRGYPIVAVVDHDVLGMRGYYTLLEVRQGDGVRYVWSFVKFEYPKPKNPQVYWMMIQRLFAQAMDRDARAAAGELSPPGHGGRTYNV